MVLATSLISPPSFAEDRGDPARNPPGAHFDLPNYLPVLDWLFGPAENAPRTKPYWRQNILRRLVGDQVYLLTTWWPDELAGVRFTLPITLATVLAGRAGSDPKAWDRITARRIHSWSRGGLHEAGKYLSRLGQSSNALLLLGSTYMLARRTGNERIERATSLSAEALLNSVLYVGFLKKLSRRTRPFSGGTGEFFVSDPPSGQSNGSYPSGHATGAFAVAAVFAHEFSDSRWIPWAAYGTAGLVALSRVSLGRHFPTDVMTGAVLGDSLGRMVSQRCTNHTEGLDPMWAH